MNLEPPKIKDRYSGEEFRDHFTSQKNKNLNNNGIFFFVVGEGGWFCWVVAARRLSLAGESEGFSLAAVQGLLIAVACLVEYGL